MPYGKHFKIVLTGDLNSLRMVFRTDLPPCFFNVMNFFGISIKNEHDDDEIVIKYMVYCLQSY